MQNHEKSFKFVGSFVCLDWGELVLIISSDVSFLEVIANCLMAYIFGLSAR